MQNKTPPALPTLPASVQEVVDLLMPCTGDAPTEQAVLLISRGDTQHIISLNIAPEASAMLLQHSATALLSAYHTRGAVVPGSAVLQ